MRTCANFCAQCIAYLLVLAHIDRLLSLAPSPKHFSPQRWLKCVKQNCTVKIIRNNFSIETRLESCFRPKPTYYSHRFRWRRIAQAYLFNEHFMSFRFSRECMMMLSYHRNFVSTQQICNSEFYRHWYFRFSKLPYRTI